MATKTRRRSPAPRKPAPRGNPQKVRVAGPPPKATAAEWIGAARLRTLPLAVSPVVAGTGAAILVDRSFHGVLALACLAVALLLQIGVNYANDYSDGIRGTDAVRVGPARLTASRRAKPRTVLTVALVLFGLAAAVGVAVTIRTQLWWLPVVGAVAIVAAFFYTGGKRPYGYSGFGEVVAFVFFGLVATVGTTFVQVRSIPQESWAAAIAVGLFAAAVLLINNLRDIDQDRRVAKRTLAARIGRRASQIVVTILIVLPFAIGVFLALFYTIAWLTLLALLGALPVILIVWTYRQPRELNVALGLASLTSLAYAGLLSWAFVG